MNLVLFSKCLYKGNIKYDFYRSLMKKSNAKQGLKLSFYYCLSKINHRFEYSYWNFINQHFQLHTEIEAFYESHQHRCNHAVLDLINEPITVLCDTPTCLCKPFLPKQTDKVIGYDINFDKKCLEATAMNEKTLIKKLKHHELTVNTVIDYEASIFTQYAAQAWICTEKGIVDGKKNMWKSIEKKLCLHLLIILFYSSMLTAFSFLCASTPMSKRLVISYLLDPKVLGLNFFPVIMLMLFLYIITKRLWASALLGGLPFIILSVTNFIKLKYRDYPVVFADLNLLSEASIMAGKYDITPKLWQIAFIVGSLILVFILIKIKPLRIHIPIYRGISAGMVLLISFFVISNTMLNDDIYNNAGDVNALDNKWIEAQQLQQRGLIYPFIYSYKKAFEVEPDNYDEALSEAILSSYQSDNIPEDKKVNVVAIMLESYNDFTKFDLSLPDEIYAPFHQIKAEGYYGTLISNVFGGGTVNTERSFLSGYFHNPMYLHKTNSYVHYFNDQGYKTVALHPSFGSFYNRRNINEYIGFQEFYYIENRYNEIAYDDDFFPDILKEYEEKTKNGQPYFNFSLNYQGHGPYPTDKRADIPDYISSQNNLTDEVRNGVNYYLNGIKNTNEQIKMLHDAFQESDKPTVMVLFGDHNPVFGQGAQGFEQLGINMDIGTKDGFLNYYSTPYVIWANQAAQKLYNNQLPKGEGPTISPNYLMNELFQYLGWQGNAYMKYTDDLKKEIPVLHTSWKLINGEWTQNISEATQQLIDQLRSVEYYYQYKINDKATE